VGLACLEVEMEVQGEEEDLLGYRYSSRHQPVGHEAGSKYYVRRPLSNRRLTILARIALDALRMDTCQVL